MRRSSASVCPARLGSDEVIFFHSNAFSSFFSSHLSSSLPPPLLCALLFSVLSFPWRFSPRRLDYRILTVAPSLPSEETALGHVRLSACVVLRQWCTAAKTRLHVVIHDLNVCRETPHLLPSIHPWCVRACVSLRGGSRPFLDAPLQFRSLLLRVIYADCRQPCNDAADWLLFAVGTYPKI